MSAPQVADRALAEQQTWDESLPLLVTELLSTGCSSSLVQRVLDCGSSSFGLRHVVDGQSVVTVEGGRVVRRRLALAGACRYDQTSDLLDLTDAVVAGRVSSAEAEEAVVRIRQAEPRVRGGLRLVGQGLLATGLAMVLGPSWRDLAVAAALALPVAALIAGLRRSPMRAVGPSVTAAVVAGCVLGLAGLGWVDHPRNVLLPLLASELPGTRLALGAVDLGQGYAARGVARLAAGVHQLALMALGVYLAASVVGADLTALVGGGPVIQGHWSAPLGVAVYVAGNALAASARPRSVPGMLVVGYTAWGVLLVGRLHLPEFAATPTAALAATLVASAARRLLRGPHPVLTFPPVFRLIVPTGLALLTLTTAAGGTAIDVGAVVFTFVAAANGIVLGISIDSAVDSAARSRSSRKSH